MPFAMGTASASALASTRIQRADLNASGTSRAPRASPPQDEKNVRSSTATSICSGVSSTMTSASCSSPLDSLGATQIH